MPKFKHTFKVTFVRAGETLPCVERLCNRRDATRDTAISASALHAGGSKKRQAFALAIGGWYLAATELGALDAPSLVLTMAVGTLTIQALPTS